MRPVRPLKSKMTMRMSASERSEETYRAPLETAPDPTVMVAEGEEIIGLNARAQTPFGYYQVELVGQEITKVIPEGFAERLTSDALQAAEIPLARQIGPRTSLSALQEWTDCDAARSYHISWVTVRAGT